MKEKLEKIKAQLCESNPIEAALLAAIWALEKECKPFRFPDEDRPACYVGLQEIINQFEKGT